MRRRRLCSYIALLLIIYLAYTVFEKNEIHSDKRFTTASPFIISTKPDPDTTLLITNQTSYNSFRKLTIRILKSITIAHRYERNSWRRMFLKSIITKVKYMYSKTTSLSTQ